MEEMHSWGVISQERMSHGLGLPTLLTKARLITSLATAINSTSSPSPPPQKSGGGTDKSSNPLLWWLVPLETSYHPEAMWGPQPRATH